LTFFNGSFEGLDRHYH